MPLDQVVVLYYRKLIKAGFEHAGSMENPSIFLDSVGENIPVCSTRIKRYIHLYIAMKEDTIADIKYLCTCDPIANVAVEIVCSLVKGKSIKQARDVTIERIFQVLGGESDDLRKSAEGLLKLLERGFTRYESGEDASGLETDKAFL